MADSIKSKLLKSIAHRLDRKHDFSQYSQARIGIGHVDGHLPTSASLDLQASFAQAKDAVFAEFPMQSIKDICVSLGLATIEVTTQVNDPLQFLLRPDLGRQLSDASYQYLQENFNAEHAYDVLLVIAGGLSPAAIRVQLPAFLSVYLQQAASAKLTIAPVILTARGRVALGDQINAIVGARLTAVLIGERPGLTTADSMGIYFTYAAKPGCTDEQRNCISNIHQYGLPPDKAAIKFNYLSIKALTQKMTGICLKDDQDLYLTT